MRDRAHSAARTTFTTGRSSRSRRSPRSLASNDSTTRNSRLHHRHDHQLGDALERLHREGARCRGSSSSPSAAPGSRSRSGRPGCRARCRACGRARSAAGSSPPGRGRRCGSPGRWESAAPAPGASTSGASRQARRSRPALPGGRVGRHLLGDARIEDADVDRRRHARLRRRAAGAPRSRRPAGAPARACRPAASSRSPCASTSVSALSSRPKVAGPRLATISGTFLRRQLLARVRRPGRGSRRRSRRRTAASAGARPRPGCRGSRPARRSAPPGPRPS